MARARLAEFTAGQLCARRALQQLGWNETAPARSGRVPVWPRGVVGSISHDDRLACAVAAEDSGCSGIGVDMATLLSPALARQLSGKILAAAEPAASWPGLTHACAITLAFSAKESVYKALYPQYGRFVDFPQVQLLYDGPGQSFRAQAVHADPVLAQWLRRTRGVFDWWQGRVITAAWLARTPACG